MRVWKIVFAVGALFNLATGLPLLFATETFLKAAGGSPSPDLLSAQLAGLLITVLGIGYGMVAWKPIVNRPIAWLGVMGKAPLILLVWTHVQAGRAPTSAFALPLVDLTFAALFLVFLLRTKPARAA